MINANRIQGVFQDNIHVGFIVRRSVISGCIQGIENGWSITKDGINWSGNYSTRKAAKAALNRKDKMIIEPNFRAETNRILSDLLKFPKDMQHNELKATLIAMFERGREYAIQEIEESECRVGRMK